MPDQLLLDRPAMLDWSGTVQPAVFYRPPWQSSVGADVVKLAASAGLYLDLWQALALEEALGRTTLDPWAADSRWATSEVCLICSRQNGKDAILEALQLAALFLWDESVLHSAHQFKTAKKAFTRLQQLILGAPHLRKRLLQPIRGRGVTTGVGNEGIHLASGVEGMFVARSKSSGRGFTVGRLIFNEAWELPEDDVAAQTPAQATLQDPQTWYVTSSPDRVIHPNAEVIAQLRSRARRGGDPDLCWIEFSADPDAVPGLGGTGKVIDGTPEAAAVARRHDEEAYQRANPAAPHRVSFAFLHRQARSPMTPKAFDVEHLGIGDWPVVEEDRWAVITEQQWEDLEDVESQLAGMLVLAADINVEGTAGAIGVAGRRLDRREHLEVIDERPGISWMVPRLGQLRDRQQPLALVIDARGRAGELLPELKSSGFHPVSPGERPPAGKTALLLMNAQDVAQAHGGFVTAARDARSIRHLGQRSLRDALAGAATRDLGDAQAWARRGGTVNIAPLVAVTEARWGLLVLEAAARPTPPAPASARAAAAPASGFGDIGKVGF